MSDLESKLEAACAEATGKKEGKLIIIAREFYPNISASGMVEVCPFCQKSGNLFSFRRDRITSQWQWGCKNSQCEVAADKLQEEGTSDTVGFLQKHLDTDRNGAINHLLDITGTHNPRAEGAVVSDESVAKKVAKSEEAPKVEKVTKKKPKVVPEPAEEIPPINLDEDEEVENITPFSKHPEGEETKPDAPALQVWNRMYQLLTLTPEDSSKLSKERGLSKEAIKAEGFKSSIAKNRELLAPLLEEFDPGILLSTGIAHKEEDGTLKISGQLCGWGLVKRGKNGAKDDWGWTHPILIPYRDATGTITMIRPHKGGLSGKSFMEENGFEISFRSARTRSKLHTNQLFDNRPDEWKDRIVLTEGEFKSSALGDCGIPAAAVPGIQMPRNNPFCEAMVERFREAGVREVIVCFDSEDRTHQPDPKKRCVEKIYAMYACHALRKAGFYSHYVALPDEWRDEKGKADWDGALARFKSKAAGKFRALLKKAAPYYPQQEFFGGTEDERTLHCELNRLIYDPQILSGGDGEQELARLIRRTPEAWRRPRPFINPDTGKPMFLPGIRATELAIELDKTRGCYYKPKRPTENMEPKWQIIAGLIRDEIRQTPHEELEEIAGLEAALAAVNHILEGVPDILTDFTISCEYLIRKQGGEMHRLFRFKNNMGEVSENTIVPPSAHSTSTKFREFVAGLGNFNPKIGDKQLQELMQDMGRELSGKIIHELEMIGFDPDSKLWIFGDCAFTIDGQVIFADKKDIIWQDGLGYRIDQQDLEQFVHKTPPKFFQKMGADPEEYFKELIATPEAIAKETAETGRIFLQQSADAISTFGSHAGLLSLGNYLSYAIAPELLKKYNGQGGQWIHGRGGAGKTEWARFLMMSWGYDAEFRTQSSSGGSTAVSIDRFFSQYSNIPISMDEFREKEADDTRNGSLRACFNRQSKTKGRMDQTNRTRSVQPRTAPIITGEGVTGDFATLTRYVELVLSKDSRLGTQEEQGARYKRMLCDQFQYHRIIRFVLMNRAWFATEVMAFLDEFIHAKDVTSTIAVDRLRLTYGIAYSCYQVLFEKLIPAYMQSSLQSDNPISKADLTLVKNHVSEFRSETISYANRANEDVASINFVVKFWDNVITSLSGSHSMKQFIQFHRCIIDKDNNVTQTNAHTDIEGSVRCVFVRSKELYAEYQKELATRRVSPDLSLEGIRTEIRREKYWVPAPTNMRNKSHRGIWDTDAGQKTYWVLRCDRMEPALQRVFDDQFGGEEDEELKF